MHIPEETNMSLTLRVNQRAEDSKTCRREAIQTGLKASQGGHNSSNYFYFTCFQGHLLRVSLPAFRLKTSRGQMSFLVHIIGHFIIKSRKLQITPDLVSLLNKGSLKPLAVTYSQHCSSAHWIGVCCWFCYNNSNVENSLSFPRRKRKLID